MMETGISDAAQVANVTVQGIQLATTLTAGGIQMLARLCSIIYHSARNSVNKKILATAGETDIKTLAKVDPNINYHSLDARLYRDFSRLAKEAGIPFVRLETFQDANRRDMLHVFYPQSMVPRMTSVNERMVYKTMELERKNGKTEEESKALADKLNRDETAKQYLQCSGAADCTQLEFDRKMQERFPEYKIEDKTADKNSDKIEGKTRYKIADKEELQETKKSKKKNSRNGKQIDEKRNFETKEVQLNEILHRVSHLGYRGYKFQPDQVVGYTPDTVEFKDANKKGITISIQRKDLGQAVNGTFFAALNNESIITIRDLRKKESREMKLKEFLDLINGKNSMNKPKKAEVNIVSKAITEKNGIKPLNKGKR